MFAAHDISSDNTLITFGNSIPPYSWWPNNCVNPPSITTFVASFIDSGTITLPSSNLTPTSSPTLAEGSQ